MVVDVSVILYISYLVEGNVCLDQMEKSVFLFEASELSVGTHNLGASFPVSDFPE
jgi:hypothetical protein